MSADPATYDPSREPFAEDGIDPRVMSHGLGSTARTTPTGHVVDEDGVVRHPSSTTRRVGGGPDARSGAWPPKSRGPLPEIAADWNVATALDELDAWAAEHDRCVTEYGEARRDYATAKRTYEVEEAKARRSARANPLERGRRTSADIDGEVTESVGQDGGPYDRFLDAESRLDVARTMMFAARDQMDRLRTHVSAAKVLDPRGA